jgi:GNAT superfamily N-acetyltransferase
MLPPEPVHDRKSRAGRRHLGATDPQLPGRRVGEEFDISEAAEVGLVVERNWRRQGLGTAMLSAAIAWSRYYDIDVLRFMFSRDNWAMRRLVASANARIDVSLDEINAEIDISGIYRN